MTSDDPSTPPSQQDYPAWSKKLAEVSYPWLMRIRNVPRGVLLIIVMLLLLGGLLLSGPEGGILVAIIGLFLLWLALLAWPTIGTGARVARVGVAVAVLGYAVAKGVGAV